jgi:hypothetical protein
MVLYFTQSLQTPTFLELEAAVRRFLLDAGR